ncbi:MAG: beta-phosphoglucomutase [Bacteroidetes bacterium]|nr:MAG: beta-phosphoglucomutase [Bacteroidota bacterium]
MINSCVFDLDGVIVDTAKYHFVAWRRLAAEFGYELTESQNEKLKGVGRRASLDLILKWAGVSLSESEKQAATDRKNEWYRALIAGMSPDEILEGVIPFLKDLKSRHIPFGLGSASSNAALILEKTGLADCFEVVIDGTKVTKGKPDPQTFLMAADAMGVAPSECIVFEDSQKGIEAAIRGGFWAIGIGEPAVLSGAHAVVPNFIGHNFETITALLPATAMS